jgi:hypothetical protein
LQVFLVDRCPVPSAAGWSAQPKKTVLPSPIAPIFGNFSSQWRTIAGASFSIFDLLFNSEKTYGILKKLTDS